MPKQDYNQYTDGEYRGQIFGMATSSSLISSRVLTDATFPGVAGTIGVDGKFTAGHDSGVVDGITLRQQTQEAQKRPADVDDLLQYPAGFIAPIMERGLVVIEYTGATPTTKEVYINDTTGEFASVAGTGFTLAENVFIHRLLPAKTGYTKARAVVEIV